MAHGKAVSGDAGRCRGLLNDVYPRGRPEINLLTSAIQEGVPRDLLTRSATLPPSAVMDRLIQRMVDDLSVSPQAARWTVESWAVALGILAERDLHTLKDPTPAPPPPHRATPTTRRPWRHLLLL